MDVHAALRLAKKAEETLRLAEDWTREAQTIGWEQVADEWLDVRQDAIGAAEVAKRLAAHIPGAPEPDDFDTDNGANFYTPLGATARLIALLENHEDLQRITTSAGPAVTVESLHRWVRDAAQSFWADGHHRAAVHAAAQQIELHLQAKLDRDDMSGTDLPRQAFALNHPQPGKPRLRFQSVKPDSQRFKSIHEGAAAFGAGLALAFRNTAAHDPLRPLAPEVAVEQLAAFSLLARMIESAVLELHPDDLPPEDVLSEQEHELEEMIGLRNEPPHSA